MKKENMQYYFGISIMLLIHLLTVLTFHSDSKYDVYLFYNHKRYLTNIIYDIAVLYDSMILTYWLSKYKRNIFRPLFYVSIASCVCYFVFYKQMASLILIPLYLWFVNRQKIFI